MVAKDSQVRKKRKEKNLITDNEQGQENKQPPPKNKTTKQNKTKQDTDFVTEVIF